MKFLLLLFLLVCNVAIAQMKCSPLELKATSTFKIVLPPKETKGTSLIVTNPKGKSYVLAMAVFNWAPIKQEEYAKMEVIEKKASSYVGHINDRDKGNIITPIFTIPGKYTVKASPNFETEDPLISGECSVTYKP